MLDHQLACSRTLAVGQENDRRALAQVAPSGGCYDGRQTRTHTGLLRPSAWVPLAWIDHAMHTSSYCGRGTCVPRYIYATHPILAVSVLERDARGCWSTSHRPLSCRCGCNRACTEHDMDAGDMPGQYAVSRAPRSHTVHIRFSGPSNVREICPHWTKGRLSLPEPDETRLCSRGLGRASTSPPRAAVAVAVIGRAVVATQVGRTAATTSQKPHKCVAHLFMG